jgi:hypothetical protein
VNLHDSHLFFPGCFTRPPGTSTRNHPHEPTTSKPVVPGDAIPIIALAIQPPTPRAFDPPDTPKEIVRGAQSGPGAFLQ